MIDLFFSVLANTGSVETAFETVSNKIVKRRLEMETVYGDYNTINDEYERLVKIYDKLDKVNSLKESKE